MKVNVKELYENECCCWYDYQPMLDAFGEIAIQVDDAAYQGDSRLLYDENGKIGVLIFGWGSCGGCDALQSCDSLEEVQELCDELQESIKWFDDKKQALEYFTNHDWQGDFSWHQTETKEFINRCIEYLSCDHTTEKGGAKEMRYRKKPVVIEAIQFNGTASNLKEIERFVGSQLKYEIFDSAWEVGKGRPHIRMQIKTLEGDMHVSVGDYIIKGVKGEFYPCKPDIFEQTYEALEEGADNG